MLHRLPVHHGAATLAAGPDARPATPCSASRHPVPPGAPPPRLSGFQPGLGYAASVPGPNRRDRSYIADTRTAARRAFEERYGADLIFAPVLVLIAAYNEEDSLDEVLRAVATHVDGHAVDILVVDDGSDDATASIVERHEHARLARLGRNCGHGVALRLGYELAAEHGASCVVTLDGDMQWDPREMPTVLAPVLAGEADLCIGSRILGTDETVDSFRRSGVRVFAQLVSLLTGVHVTDTSSGFRAMRTEVCRSVPQTQVQYQTAELLIGAIAQGYRVVERPVTMHRRLAGESKKGHNFLYGFRYARVTVSTWLRERRRARNQAEGTRAGREGWRAAR